MPTIVTEPRPVTCSIPAFMRYSGFGRSHVYNLLKAGLIEAVTISRRKMIVLASYDQLIEQRRAEHKAEIDGLIPKPKRGRPAKMVRASDRQRGAT
jgi:hypothetical protein